jgi:hypothetical protein
MLLSSRPAMQAVCLWPVMTPQMGTCQARFTRACQRVAEHALVNILRCSARSCILGVCGVKVSTACTSMQWFLCQIVTVFFNAGDQFFIFKFDGQQAGLSGLAFDEGEFGVFGYVTSGMEDVVAKLETGDKIVTASLVSGADRLVNVN